MKKRGTNGADEISGTGRADTIRGLAGDDIINSGGGYDTIYGGAGNDTIYVTFGGKLFSGDAGNDMFKVVGLSFGGSKVAVNGGKGTDTFDANSVAGGADYLYFVDNADDRSIAVGDYVVSGVEVIQGGFGKNWFELQNQTDGITLFGGEQDDVFIPSFNPEDGPEYTGNHVMYGLGGNDAFTMRYGAEAYGGDGDDTFSLWWNARSTMDGGNGIDTIELGYGGNVDLSQGVLNLGGGSKSYVSNVENVTINPWLVATTTVVGNDAANVITIAAADSTQGITINGKGGADTILSGGGADTLIGGGGSDTLDGGRGTDVLTGGAGADHFRFTDADALSPDPQQADRITDFSRTQRDRIELNEIDANTLKDGDQAFRFIRSNAFSERAGELRFEVTDGSTIVSGDTNGDGIADFVIKLDGVTMLQATDFQL